MKKHKITAAVMVTVALLSGAVQNSYVKEAISVEAHWGGASANGGHHGSQSGLGGYYCGGYPAHLHENGVCPYVGTGIVSDTLEADDYVMVFDYTYYYNTYTDLQQAIGLDEDKLLEHFVNCGMAEGRNGCADFDVTVYKDNNSDLAAAYGDDLERYYGHYMKMGCNEGRIHHRE